MRSRTIGVLPSALDSALRTLTAPATDHVDVWAVDIRHLTPLPGALAAVLSREEQERGARFLRDADRQRFSIARVVLRHVLARLAGCAPDHLQFERSEAGKPSLRYPAVPLAFNVSHSGEIVLIAWTARRTVGVDVERIRPDIDVPALSEICFSPRERSVVLGADDPGRLPTPDEISRRFFRHWACKESWIKADGRGMGLPLRSFSLIGTDLPGCYTVEGDGDLLPWRTRAFSTIGGYASAVTSDSGQWAIRLQYVG